MDGTWSSAKSVYRDNMLQYKLTGESKYKNVADQAMATLNKILESKKIQSPQLHTDYLKQQDMLVGAQMRQPTIVQPSMTWQYLTLGSLLITLFVLHVV
jgi:uncharacterized protein YyaL (SSP411 family)